MAAEDTWVAWRPPAGGTGCTAVGAAPPEAPLRGAITGAEDAGAGDAGAGDAGAGSAAMAGFGCMACMAAPMSGTCPPSSWRTCARWLAMLSFCLVSSSTSRCAAARRRSASALVSASICSAWDLA